MKPLHDDGSGSRVKNGPHDVVIAIDELAISGPPGATAIFTEIPERIDEEPLDKAAPLDFIISFIGGRIEEGLIQRPFSRRRRSQD